MKITTDILKDVDQDLADLREKARLKIKFGHDYIWEFHPIGVIWVAKWKVVEDKNVPTMCTNGKQLRYNPDFTAERSVGAVKWIILHEAMHLLLGHHVRRGHRHPKAWNIAGDLAINWLIKEYAIQLDVFDELFKELGCLMPRMGEYAKMKEGESSEYYYRRIEQDALDEITDDQPGATEDTGEPCDDGDGGDEGEGSEPGEGGDAKEGEARPASDSAEDGEASGGSALDDKLDEIAERSTIIGDVEDSPTIEEEGKDVAEQEYEQTATQAVVMMKEQGKGAGFGMSIIEDMIEKKAVNDWRKLREKITKLTIGGRYYKRPHRRRSNGNIILPSNRSKGKTTGAIVVDTSGSMGTHEMDEAFVQLSGLLREWPKAVVTMIQCDSIIHDKAVKTYDYNDLPLRIPREWLGRGGTEMQPGVNWLAERRQDFDWAIFITDMGFSWGALTESGIPTFFVGVNASPDIVMPQRTYDYIPVIVE